jgi:hypothetical protein
MKAWIGASGLLLLSASVCPAAQFTLNAVNSGFYRQDGSHQPDNYAAGWFGVGTSPPNIELRDYFVFDLSPVSGTILSAHLHLSTMSPNTTGFSSPDPSETYTLLDVSTSLSTLTGGTGGVSAFTDLGTGTVLGAVTVDSSLGATVDVPLNSAGILTLQGQTGLVALGGAITTLAKGSPSEFLFNSTNATLTRQLVITTDKPKTYTVPPCRVLDTRLSSPPGPIAGAAARDVRVVGPLGGLQGGAADCGVPVGATSVFINVVAVGGGGPGHLTAYPSGSALPLASTLNFSTGDTVANGVLIPVCTPYASCAADVTIQMGPAAAHLVIDVTGYVGP